MRSPKAPLATHSPSELSVVQKVCFFLITWPLLLWTTPSRIPGASQKSLWVHFDFALPLLARRGLCSTTPETQRRNWYRAVFFLLSCCSPVPDYNTYCQVLELYCISEEEFKLFWTIANPKNKATCSKRFYCIWGSLAVRKWFYSYTSIHGKQPTPSYQGNECSLWWNIQLFCKRLTC